MAHELTTREDGTVEMAYAGKTPWHGLGNHVENAMTAEEAIVAAGLDWEVNCEPVFRSVGGTMIQVPGRQAIVRADTDEVFNIFSETYQPVQNKDAFSFFDGVVGAGEAVYETAGSLRGGRRIWILAKLPGDLKIDNDENDILEKYILLANSHDGTMTAQMKITPIRVVCNNTLEWADHQAGKRVRYRHTTNILSRMNETRSVLGLTDAYFELFMRNVTKLAQTKFSEGDMRNVAKSAINLTESRATAGRKAKVDAIVKLYHEGTGAKLATADGAGWGAINAVTEFLDHTMGVRGSKAANPDELACQGQRLDISWFGDGREVRQRAWNASLAIANGEVGNRFDKYQFATVE